jgi:RsiW-degrading membrane proteinase PrsW (M82 family)
MLIFSLIQAIAGKELSVAGHFWVLIIGLVIFVILFMWADMWGDYLRIYRVTSEEGKLRAILKPSLRFVFRNFGRTVSLYYLLSLILLGTLIAYLGLSKILHFIPADKLLILSLFILQQAYSLFRSFYRLVYYSSQLVLFDKLYSLR